MQVDLRPLEDARVEAGEAGLPGQLFACPRHDLHEADRPDGALDHRVEHRLLADEPRDEERIETSLSCFGYDKVSIREWVDDAEEAQVPGALAAEDLPAELDPGEGVAAFVERLGQRVDRAVAAQQVAFDAFDLERGRVLPADLPEQVDAGEGSLDLGAGPGVGGGEGSTVPSQKDLPSSSAARIP